MESLKQGRWISCKSRCSWPLLAAIERAEQATQAAATRLAQLAAFERLTPRERQLLQLIARGHKNQQIAQDLCISVRTVEVPRQPDETPGGELPRRDAAALRAGERTTLSGLQPYKTGRITHLALRWR